MCTNYTPTTRDHLKAMHKDLAPLPELDWPAETYPGYLAPILTLSPANEAWQCKLARFGLIPRWCKGLKQATEMSRRTYNARSETVAEKPSFRGPWRERRLALAPMEHFYEPNWETGKAVRWQIGLASAEPFTVAGLWEDWTDYATGEVIASFTLLTVNADGHAVMGRMHRPGDEKRMPVIVPEASRQAWLTSTVDQAGRLMCSTDARLLSAIAAPRVASAKGKATKTTDDTLNLF